MAELVMITPEGRHYHEPGWGWQTTPNTRCGIYEGKGDQVLSLEMVDVGDAERRGLTPCGTCFQGNRD